VIIAERLLQAFREIEACGGSCTVVGVFFTLTADEGRSTTKVYMDADDLLRTDALHAGAQRAKLSVVNGGKILGESK
jgi:hypothetical protein